MHAAWWTASIVFLGGNFHAKLPDRSFQTETSRQKLPDRSERVAYFVFGLVTPGGGSFDAVMPKELGGLSAIGVAIGGFAVCAA